MDQRKKPQARPRAGVSRQRRWQLRQFAMKKCIKCAKPVPDGSPLCKDHRAKAKENRRRRDGTVKHYTSAEDWKNIDWSLPVQVIADQMGVEPGTVRWRRRTVGKPPRVSKEEAWAAMDWTRPHKDIAAEMKVTLRTVRWRYWKKHRKA